MKNFAIAKIRVQDDFIETQFIEAENDKEAMIKYLNNEGISKIIPLEVLKSAGVINIKNMIGKIDIFYGIKDITNNSFFNSKMQ